MAADPNTAKALAALDTMAAMWAAKTNARHAVRTMLACSDAEDRLMAYLQHAHAEGLFEGFHAGKSFRRPDGVAPSPEADMRSVPRALFIDLDSYLRHIECFGTDDQKRVAEAVRKTVAPHLAGVAPTCGETFSRQGTAVAPAVAPAGHQETQSPPEGGEGLESQKGTAKGCPCKQSDCATLREALQQIADMDANGIRADDLGRAARISRAALAASPSPATEVPQGNDAPKQITACPRCGAETEDDAGELCNGDDTTCPMCLHEDWDESMAELNRQAAIAAAPSVAAQTKEK